MPVERLQKVLAAGGVASRRASEALIAAGRVRVDGRVAKVGESVDPSTARIEVDGMPVGVGAARAYLALHKPAGVTSTVRDRHATATVLDLVPTALVPDGARLYPVGRLDRDSEGLLLLTNDGDWAERVLHPRFGVEREYAVAVGGPLSADAVVGLDAGVELDEGRAHLVRRLRRLSATEVAAFSSLVDPRPGPDLAWYRATLTQGWKRQLRRMFGAVGAPVVRLVRVRIGAVSLGSLPAGRARRLTAPEIRSPGAPEPRRDRTRRPTAGYPQGHGSSRAGGRSHRAP